MSLVIIGDSQVERVWRNVRQNREILQTAVYAPVKRFAQLHDGLKAMSAQVKFLCDLMYCYNCWDICFIV